MIFKITVVEALLALSIFVGHYAAAERYRHVLLNFIATLIPIIILTRWIGCLLGG